MSQSRFYSTTSKILTDNEEIKQNEREINEIINPSSANSQINDRMPTGEYNKTKSIGPSQDNKESPKLLGLYIATQDQISINIQSDIKENDQNNRESNTNSNIRNNEERREQVEIQVIQENEPLENSSRQGAINEVPVQIQEVRQPEVVNNGQNIDQLWVPEVKIFLSKGILLFGAIILASIYVLLITFYDISYDGLFLICEIYFGFLIFIELLWTKKVLGSLWAGSVNESKMLDAAAWIIALLIAYLSFLRWLPLAILATIPFMGLALASLFYSDMPPHKKFWANSLRIIYLIQILIITMKTDGIISDLDWQNTFLMTWVFLSIRSFFCFRSGLGFLKLLTSAMSQRNQGLSLEDKIKIKGLFWCTLYYGLNILAVFALEGVRQAFSGKPSQSFELLNYIAYLGIAIGVFMILFTSLMKEHLIQFIIMTKMIESNLFEAHMDIQKKNKLVSLQAEKKEIYFVMISQSYFQPLNESFHMKDEKDLQALKSKLKNFKFVKSELVTPFHQGGLCIESHIKESKIPSKQFNRNFDLNFLKIWKDNTKTGVQGNIGTDRAKIDNRSIREQRNIAEQERVQANRKISRSFDNHRSVEKTSKINEESAHCYICCVQQPDAIVGNCGHGGVCFECVSTLIKKKDECMQCRQRIEAVYRINPVPVLFNIFKGIELNRVIVQSNS